MLVSPASDHTTPERKRKESAIETRSFPIPPFYATHSVFSPPPFIHGFKILQCGLLILLSRVVRRWGTGETRRRSPQNGLLPRFYSRWESWIKGSVGYGLVWGHETQTEATMTAMIGAKNKGNEACDRQGENFSDPIKVKPEAAMGFDFPPPIRERGGETDSRSESPVIN